MKNYHGPSHHADDEDRRAWQNPDDILADTGLRPGLTFIDIGCGGGFFTLPAARIVGKKGSVFGVDINTFLLNELKEAAAREGLTNVRVTPGTGEDTVLCQACADIVFFGIVLHDFHDAAAVLKNARTMLKPGGRLVNLDWKKLGMTKGPPVEKRLSEKTAIQLIEAAGFSVETRRDAGPHHYLITARL